MREMIQIDKYVGKVHKKFMNVKTTTEDHMTRDLWFSMNLMQMALRNLDRWSHTTSEPKRAFNAMLKKAIKDKK